MKNLDNVETICKCYSCKKIGFFCETPFSGDRTTCPLCNEMCDIDQLLSTDEFRQMVAHTKECGVEVFQLGICTKCNIVYDLGCTHSIQGCTDDIYNAHVISKWMHIPTHLIYNGMPRFENLDDIKTHFRDVHILEMSCLNNNSICSRDYPLRPERTSFYSCDLVSDSICG